MLGGVFQLEFEKILKVTLFDKNSYNSIKNFFQLKKRLLIFYLLSFSSTLIILNIL